MVWLLAACLQQRQSGKKAALVLRSSLIMMLGMRRRNEVGTKTGQKRETVFWI
jgi:hypothetical protein